MKATKAVSGRKMSGEQVRRAILDFARDLSRSKVKVNLKEVEGEEWFACVFRGEKILILIDDSQQRSILSGITTEELPFNIPPLLRWAQSRYEEQRNESTRRLAERLAKRKR